MSTRPSGNPAPFPAGAVYVAVFAIAVPLTHFVLGRTVDRAAGNPLITSPDWLQAAGGGLTAAGLALIVASIAWLYILGRGLPLSSSPPPHLVTSGPYTISRHPIYLGALLAFLGASLLLSSFWCTVVAGPLLGFFYFTYACGIEEPVLLSRFGHEYREYQERTALFVEFPFRNHLYRLVCRALERLSRSINRPKIIRRGNHLFFWGYGIWVGAGVALGLSVMEFVLIAQGLPASDAALAVVVVTAVGLLGARVSWRTGVTVRDGGGFSCSAWKAGFVSWGVLAGLLVVLPLLAWRIKASPYLLFDVVFPSLMVTNTLGRIGCAFYGCCYGKETATGARLRYEHPELKSVREGRVRAEALRPVQLISALNGAVIAALVFGLWFWLPLPLTVPAAMAAVMYGFFRLGEEWLRSQSVVLWGIVSPAQLFALALALLGLTYLSLIPAGGGPLTYHALRDVSAASTLQQIHPFLLAASGLVTTLALSYHYGAVGRWK